jgi:DNA-binding transcriptional MerR regulator
MSKEKTPPYTTSYVARTIGVHPNTVRKYEEWGFLPPIPRAANGYRQFSDYHLDQMRLARLALTCSWISGPMRERALAVIQHGAAGELAEGLAAAQDLQGLVLAEQGKADEAADILQQWVNGQLPAQDRPPLTTTQAARHLDVSVDQLRNWERNGLLDVPRDAANGYRQYGPPQISRLHIIRLLRRARYSHMAILRMLQQVDTGQIGDVRAALDTPPPDEDLIYVTDRWLTTLGTMLESVGKLLELLREMQSRYG